MKNIANTFFKPKRRNRAIKKANEKLVISQREINKINDEKEVKKINGNNTLILDIKKNKTKLKTNKDYDYSKLATAKKGKTKKETKTLASSEGESSFKVDRYGNEIVKREPSKQKVIKGYEVKNGIWDDENYDNTHIGNKRQKLIEKEQRKLEKYNKRREKNYQKALAEMEDNKNYDYNMEQLRTAIIFNQLVTNDNVAKEKELNEAKEKFNDLSNRRKAYKEYYNSLKEMEKNNLFSEEINKDTIYDKQIDSGLISKTVTIKEKDISRLSIKEQKKVLEKIKNKYKDYNYSVYEIGGVVIVDKKIDYKKEKQKELNKRLEEVKQQNKEIVERAKQYLDDLEKEYKEAKKHKEELNKKLKAEKDEINKQLKQEREVKKAEEKEKKQTTTKKLLESLNYDFEIIDEDTIERVREIFDPKRMRNIKTKEKISIKQLMKEQEFIEKYNKEMEEIGWDNHKISYLELNKIMNNKNLTKYSQIDRPKKYQKKVRTRAINNVLKSLSSAGLGNTDFYAFVEKHLNLSNIDGIIANLNEGEIYDLFSSDQSTSSNSLKKFVQGFKLSGDIKFRGRTLSEILEEAEQKI